MGERPSGEGAGPDREAVEELPRVTCSRCEQEWELDYELNELRAGNRSVEQFALDHERHTGHFPDDVSPWIADCRECPQRELYIAERPGRRWARTHTRHTGHVVAFRPPAEEGSPELILED